MSWIDELASIQLDPHFDLAGAVREAAAVHGDEPALLGAHAASTGHHSGVVIRESGAVELFAHGHMGLRIDPTTGSILLYAPRLKLMASEIDLYSLPAQVRWNKMPLWLSPIAAPPLYSATLLPVPDALSPVKAFYHVLSQVVGG